MSYCQISKSWTNLTVLRAAGAAGMGGTGPGVLGSTLVISDVSCLCTEARPCFFFLLVLLFLLFLLFFFLFLSFSLLSLFSFFPLLVFPLDAVACDLSQLVDEL